jgi:hypothetical protein
MSLLLADGDARNILVTLWSANSSSTLIKALYTFQEQTFHKAYQIDLAGWYWCWAGLNLCSHLYLFIALIVLLRSFVQASQGGIRKRLRLFVFASRSRCTYDLELSRRMLIQLCGQVYPSQIYALPRVQKSLRARNLSAPPSQRSTDECSWLIYLDCVLLARSLRPRVGRSYHSAK